MRIIPVVCYLGRRNWSRRKVLVFSRVNMLVSIVNCQQLLLFLVNILFLHVPYDRFHLWLWDLLWCEYCVQWAPSIVFNSWAICFGRLMVKLRCHISLDKYGELHVRCPLCAHVLMLLSRLHSLQLTVQNILLCVKAMTWVDTQPSSTLTMARMISSTQVDVR